MNPIIAEVYSTVIPAAPFVLAAYVGIWVVLLIYVAYLGLSLKKTRDEIAVLTEALERREQAAKQ